MYISKLEKESTIAQSVLVQKDVVELSGPMDALHKNVSTTIKAMERLCVGYDYFST